MRRAGWLREVTSILWYWVPVLLWMGLIFFSSSHSSLPRPGEALGIADEVVDSVAHALAFGMLAFLVWRALGGQPVMRASGEATPYWGAAAFAALYGIVDEAHQALVPGRCPSAIDWLADVVGIVLVLAALARFGGRPAKWLRSPVGRGG